MKFPETIGFFAAASVRSLSPRQPALKSRKKWQRKEFARLEGIRDWKIHAALIELEAIDIAEEPDTPSRLSLPRTSERLHQQRP
jgi:hypothetical protein